MAAKAMTKERALNNAIVSVEMEGFVVTDSQKILMKKVLNGEMSLSEALSEINHKYQ